MITINPGNDGCQAGVVIKVRQFGFGHFAGQRDSAIPAQMPGSIFP